MMNNNFIWWEDYYNKEEKINVNILQIYRVKILSSRIRIIKRRKFMLTIL